MRSRRLARFAAAAFDGKKPEVPGDFRLSAVEAKGWSRPEPQAAVAT